MAHESMQIGNHNGSEPSTTQPSLDLAVREVAFGTGGDLAGEIFVYEVRADQVRPGMTEEEAMAAAQAMHDEDYAPEIRDFAPRPGSPCRVHPSDAFVWTPEGELLQRDAAGEPCHFVRPDLRSVGSYILRCHDHDQASAEEYSTREDALESGWRCPVVTD